MHLIYTLPDGMVHQEERDFESLEEAEAYLKDIGAIEWCVGL